MSKWGALKVEAHKVGREVLDASIGQLWSPWWDWGDEDQRAAMAVKLEADLKREGLWEQFVERLSFKGEGSDRSLRRYLVARKVRPRSAALPPWRPAALPLCHSAALPPCRPAALPLCRSAALPPCRSAALPLCRST